MLEYVKTIINDFHSSPRKIDSKSKIFKNITSDMPLYLSSFLLRDDLKIYGSMGKGYKTDYPWIAILNKDITTTTQEGLYIVYLFRSDMKGLYLTLSQGITNFERNFGRKKYDYAVKVANYFKQEFFDLSEFSLNPIDLASKKGSLGYGYEKTTILSKYYCATELNEDEMLFDLKKMLEVYDSIYQHMGSKTYNQVIESVLFDENVYYSSDKAISDIRHILREESSYPRDNIKRLTQVRPLEERSTKLKKIVNGAQTKIDYVKKAAQDAYTGLEGEELALSYERDRLTQLGLYDYVNKIEWVSSQNDVAGFDIKSYDIDSSGKISELYIEVKTSVSKVDVDFYVSKNEVETSIRLKNNYCVFRIYDVLSISPKFYIAHGSIEENFYLEPVTFKASYKWRVD